MTKTWRKFALQILSLSMIAALMVTSPAEAQTGAEGEVQDVLSDHPELVETESGSPTIDIAGGDLDATVLLAQPGESQMTTVTLSRSVGKAATDRGGRQWETVTESSQGVDSVAQGIEGGLRIFEVLDNRDSDHRFIYKLTVDNVKQKFFLQPDGSVHVGTGSAGDYQPVGAIAAPWAMGADGSDVGVRYRVSPNGRKLILKVDTASAGAYPVVADPSFSAWVGITHCSWGSCTFYLERAKTYWIRDVFATKGFAVGSAIVGSAFCGWVAAAAASTGPGVFFAGLACAAWVAAKMWDIQNHANQGRSCLTVKRKHWSNWASVSHSSNKYCKYNV